jgi:hypothetical protein
MWLCSKLGAREHYAIPRPLFRQGGLEQLLTDAWAPSGSALAFHRDLTAFRGISC